MKIIDRINKLIFVPLLIINLVITGQFIYSRAANVLPYKPSTITQIDYGTIIDVNEKYITKRVNRLFSNPQYFLIRKDIDGAIIGYTRIVLRLVVIEEEISEINYTITLTHELVHLTHVTANERYTSFMTFVILYESGIEYFTNVALYYANLQVKGCYPYDYDCSGYIEEYLKQPSS